MADAGYSCTTEGAVALVATTAKTVIGVQSHANHGLSLTGFQLAFDGVTATDKAVLVEVCYSTWATNAPGTNSTATTVRQQYGRSLAASSTFRSGKTWSSEPTALTVIEEFLLTPIGGTVVFDYPLGKEPDCAVSEGFAIRLTAPTSAVNARGTLKIRRA